MSPELVPFHCSLSVSFGLLPTPFLILFSFMVNRQAASQLFSHMQQTLQLRPFHNASLCWIKSSPWTPQRVWLGLVTCPDPGASALPHHPSNTSTHSRYVLPGPCWPLVQTDMHFCLGSHLLRKALSGPPTGCRVVPPVPPSSQCWFACGGCGSPGN